MLRIGGCRFDAGGQNYRKELVHVRTGVSNCRVDVSLLAKISVNPTDAFSNL